MSTTPRTTLVLVDSDIAFAQERSMHHQQAITMTDMLGRDAAPDVRALAAQIRASQWQEIGILTGWPELAGAPASRPGTTISACRASRRTRN
nr:DUF305 domain-containing protein [Rhodococcus zopfii]